ncbi:hypothetical protein COCOR_05112 [Corallococcus coralloides DSM 2259]|uniref:Carrier domain-containing protein n=1 Tax=Corallococcus coralloides (strain ATCC 25202 / DSM 2259 / NBRC 100086 / M2) TaxID=1144275 RepID=H8MRD1_CORCM|nr:acyl carrier protein [Corallococcus coralloides]AFE06196.1 hypothetical protein COCOR_05112 [Corallococcus coralloides DSM 2259]
MEETTTTPGRSREQVENWLVNRIAEVAGLSQDAVDIQSPFVDYRLDSAVAVTVTAEFSRWLGRELPITAFWEYPTIQSLAGAVASDGGAAPSGI